LTSSFVLVDFFWFCCITPGRAPVTIVITVAQKQSRFRI